MAAMTEVEVIERSTDSTPAEVAETRDSAEHVFQLLDQLPENQQEVVRLKFQGGLSYRAISEVTGLSVSNVGYLLHQAIHTLRRRTQASGT